MGYCVDFKGRFTLDGPLPDDVVYEIRDTDRRESGYPGEPPDRRFNPWVLADDGLSFEVLTDKPGDWKAWLQYVLDTWVTPSGRTLSGSVEWDGEESGDNGVITVEDGRVRARRALVKFKWAEMSKAAQKPVVDRIMEAMHEDNGARDQAWLAALDALGWQPATDRTEFDE